MKTLDYIYEVMCNTTSDINEHIPVLKKYAEKCNHITEMGVRAPVSLWGFIAAKPAVLRAYDIDHPDKHMEHSSIDSVSLSDAERICLELGIDFKFFQRDVLGVEIEETDLLFIDTEHNFYQLRQELGMHAGKVHKYIIMHDVETWGSRGELYGRPNLVIPGLIPAIQEFLMNNTNWEVIEHLNNNNGLMILERR